MPRVIFSGAAAWVTLGVLLAALTWAGWSQWRINGLHERIGQAHAAIDTAARAADSSRAALRVCIAGYEQTLADLALAQESERQANIRREQEAARLARLLERERDKRREAYENECEHWAAEPICPSVADSLRRAARGD